MEDQNFELVSKKDRGIILFISTFGIILVLLVTITLGFISLVYYIAVIDIPKNGCGRTSSVDTVYRYHEYSHQTGESRKFGFISLPKSLEIDHLSYMEEESSSHILISNLDSQEYQCSGTCVCSSDSNRRFSNVMIKPFVLFVAAISSILAYNMAKDNFQLQCEESLSDTCSHDSILSEVDGCEPVLSVDDEMEKSEEGEMDDENNYILGLITHPNLEEAKILGGKMVERELIACANIVPKIYSIYSWKGNIERDEEVLMIVKTKEELKKEVIDYVIKNHPYECPEVIFTDIKSGSKDYLSWIGDQTKKI